MLELNNVTKRYGNKVVVDNLTFKLEKGEILGFLGPNGAGKSTTMNIITGYLGATSGTVFINGHDSVEKSDIVRGLIGYLPETPPVYVDMTVKEYLKFVCELKNVNKAQIKTTIEEVAKIVKLDHVTGRLIKNLSKGYKQRVGIAQAIIGNPDIVIFDEPTVGLDPKEIVEIRKLIKDIGKDKTVILSSHILSEIEEVCDRILVINEGKFVDIGTKEELKGKLTSTEIIFMSVKGEVSVVIEEISCVNGVEEIEFIDEDSDNISNFKIKLSKGIDPREDIFYKLCEKKIPLVGMRKDELDLEKIFLQITK